VTGAAKTASSPAGGGERRTTGRLAAQLGKRTTPREPPDRKRPAAAAGNRCWRAEAGPRAATLAGTALFVLGFSALFASYGAAFRAGWARVLLAHQRGPDPGRSGRLTILLGLLFAGAFRTGSRSAGRMLRPSFRPAGRAWPGRRCWGVLFGLGWTAVHRADADRSADLGGDHRLGGAAARSWRSSYGLGIGIPFLGRGGWRFSAGHERVSGFAPARHAALVTRVGRGDAGRRRRAAGQRCMDGGDDVGCGCTWIGGYELPL